MSGFWAWTECSLGCWFDPLGGHQASSVDQESHVKTKPRSSWRIDKIFVERRATQPHGRIFMRPITTWRPNGLSNIDKTFNTRFCLIEFGFNMERNGNSLPLSRVGTLQESVSTGLNPSSEHGWGQYSALTVLLSYWATMERGPRNGAVRGRSPYWDYWIRFWAFERASVPKSSLGFTVAPNVVMRIQQASRRPYRLNSQRSSPFLEISASLTTANSIQFYPFS